MENFKPLVERIRRLTEMVGICDIDKPDTSDALKDRAREMLDTAIAGLEGELHRFDLDAALDHCQAPARGKNPWYASRASGTVEKHQTRGSLLLMKFSNLNFVGIDKWKRQTKKCAMCWCFSAR
jgi:hypothetical protein